ncbi:MAG: hypothetical protein J3K34DRAFT_420838 [Monoraphidium minutum]|nr:MAG: hypothetical protein J3K34DRAFT_420838 [Monoraphidium minutum]
MAPVRAAAVAALLLACAAAAGAVQVKKCEWAAEYGLCVATPAAVFPYNPKSPNRLASKDVEVWARETLCAVQNTKELCGAAAKPEGEKTSDPCFWDPDQGICRADVPFSTDVACPGDLAELTNYCTVFEKKDECLKEKPCTWDWVNGKERCYPQRVKDLGISTVAAYFVHYYYNPATFGTCDASKGYREFLKKCWSKSKDDCASSWPTCKWWPNEGVCTTTQSADAAYLTGADGRSVAAEKACMGFTDEGACKGSGTTDVDPAKALKHLKDNAPIPGLTSFGK